MGLHICQFESLLTKIKTKANGASLDVPVRTALFTPERVCLISLFICGKDLLFQF